MMRKIGQYDTSATPANCTLKGQDRCSMSCNPPRSCVRCGWDHAEAARRKELIRDGHMQKDSLGYLRLFLRRNNAQRTRT